MTADRLAVDDHVVAGWITEEIREVRVAGGLGPDDHGLLQPLVEVHVAAHDRPKLFRRWYDLNAIWVHDLPSVSGPRAGSC